MKTTGKDKDQAALRFYEKLYREKQYDGAQLTAEDLRSLLETGREELLVRGHSCMLDCAFERLSRAARRKPERIAGESTGLLLKFGPAERNPVPLADCWYYMVCLQKYMTEELTAEELEAWAEIACTGRTIRPKEVITAGGLRNVIRGISEAVEECREKLLSGGQSRAGREKGYAREQADFSSLFADMRGAMTAMTQKMNGLEQKVTSENTRRASSQLLDLFNLIADYRDSVISAMNELPESQDGSGTDINERDAEDEREVMIDNLLAFMDMISEYLDEYGVSTIRSESGTPFDGKYHEAEGSGMFDPRRAVVGCSLRRGFCWGGQVLQKERIRLETGNM